ncbi:MAG: hypothetical protein J6R47_01410 [Acholeplasmatales bacterium]|nr:hypothetical protein [Acholeplasmatales bacterium]
MNANIVIKDNELEINNITQLKEFNEESFEIEINDKLYEIKGTNLLLKDVYNENKSIRISGVVYSIIQKNHKKTDSKSFFKKLFS